MTKEQAQEYATRIRLGEPLLARDGGGLKPIYFCLGDSVVCRYVYYRRGKRWSYVPPIRVTPPTFARPPLVLPYGGHDYRTVLEVLDKWAK
jgi:hypothetical protein